MTIFDCGVASGDVTTDGVVLWTRVAGLGDCDHRDVDWTIGRPGAPPLESGRTTAADDHDGTIHVAVERLPSGTDLEYSFEAGGERVVGRTRTLPDTAERFRLVVACCSRWGWPGFDDVGAIVDERPDLLLHLGDSIYEVGEVPPNGVPTDPPWECHTLDDYRRRYRQHRRSPAMRKLLASAPMVVVWDDHEVDDNAPDPGADTRRRAGQRAWAEWMPSRSGDRSGPLDRRFSIDGLLDLTLLDARFSGRGPTDVSGPGDADRPRGSILDPVQWDRLEAFAADATAPWFVVANQVQVGPMTLAARPARQWPPWRRVVNPDQWDGYAADRDHLYDLLGRVPGRPVLLSGDLHSAWSRSLRSAGTELAHEFTCPSISGITYAGAVRRRLPVPAPVLHRWLRLWNRGIDHLDLSHHGHLVCDVTPERWTTTFVMTNGRRHEISLRRQP